MSIFFFDIDGTLANGLDVPESAAKALLELRRRGHLVFICTGRPDNYVHEHFGQYCDGSICFNGRYAELNGKCLYDYPLTSEQVEEITRIMDDHHCGYLFYNNEHEFTGGYYDGSYSPMDTQGEDVYNFNIYFDNHKVLEDISEAMKNLCIFNPHGPAPHADATVLGSDKGTAIRIVLEKLGISKEDSYAFGDGANDVCMMKEVGHSICMGNGLDVTKAVSEYVTTDINDNGIYNALVYYGIITQ